MAEMGDLGTGNKSIKKNRKSKIRKIILEFILPTFLYLGTTVGVFMLGDIALKKAHIQSSIAMFFMIVGVFTTWIGLLWGIFKLTDRIFSKYK